jgi:signal transduction histidine kinase
MSHTIDDFRNFFRPDRQVSTSSLQEAIEAILALIGAQLKSHGIAVQKEMPPEPVTITGPFNQFKQALLNLFSNAQDAIDDARQREGMITVSLKQDKRAILKVCDNGGGIAPEALDRVFDPYYTTKEPGKGTGIGLYMTRTIIEEQFKGEIRGFNSDEGACFEVVL